MRKKILLSLFGLASALIITEIFLRIFSPQIISSNIRPVFSFNCFTKTSYSWIHLRKNATCSLSSNTSNDFKNIVVMTNSLGIRNEEIQTKKPKNNTRILFVGDSFTMGWGIPEEKAFPKQTEIMLHKLLPDTSLQAINAGVPATAVDNYYLSLKNEWLSLEPDYVVIGFFPYNDILSDTRWTQVDKDGLPEKIASTLYFINNEGSLDDKRIPLKFRIPVLRDSHLFSLIMGHLPASLVGRNDMSFSVESSTDLLCIFKRFCHDEDKKKDTTKKLFLALKKLTIAHHAKLVILMIPAILQVYDNIPQPFQVPITPEDKKFVNEDFDAFFRKNKISYIDLLPPMHERQQENFYFDNDPHWNEYGHHFAATILSQLIAADLQKKASPGNKETTTNSGSESMQPKNKP